MINLMLKYMIMFYVIYSAWKLGKDKNKKLTRKEQE